jgi:hypothetical protein
MSWQPPGSQRYGAPQGAPPPPQGGSPLAKRLLTIAVALIAIPLIAFVLFLAAMLVVSLVAGPIRWN